MTDIPMHTEDDRTQIVQHIQALDLTRPWVVTVRRKVARRSLSQNALFHMWCGEVGREVGYDIDEAKHWIKEVCDCPVKAVTINGQRVEIRSTKALEMDEMREFMDRVYRRLVGDMGIYLTIPPETMTESPTGKGKLDDSSPSSPASDAAYVAAGGGV